MRHSFLLLCGLVCTALSAQPENLAVSAIPAELRANANSVVRSSEISYRSLDQRHSVTTERRVITVLNDNHDYANRLILYYDADCKITKLKATLYDARGEKVRSAKKSEIEDVRALSGGQFYTDSRVRTVNLVHLTYPYTVEFEYEISKSDFAAAFVPRWTPQAYDQSVEYASFSAEVPTDNELRYRDQGLAEPDLVRTADAVTRTWTVTNLPARRSEPYAPPVTRTLPCLEPALLDFRVDDYRLSNRNWEEFGRGMLQLHQDIRELPPGLAKLVTETTAGLTTDREKIAALYALLQDRTRYVGVQLGIGGWQPFSAEYVEENRYGDCKALSNYMGAMLDAVGIANYPVLINWDDRPAIAVEPDFTVTAFNHMILYVPGEDMYLECTSNDSPAGYLGDDKQDRNVVWLTPEGGKLMRTPAQVPGENGHVRTTELTIDDSGNATFDLRVGYHGATQERLRMFLRGEADPGEQLDYLHRIDVLPSVTGAGYTTTVAEDRPVVELTYRDQLPRYVRKVGKRTFLPVNKLFRYGSVPDPVEDRQFPVLTTATRFLVDTVRLSWSEGLEIESLGETVTEIDHPAGHYRAEVTAAPGGLTWVRTLKLNPVELPPAEYKGFRDFYVAVNKAERRQIVLKEKRTKK